MEVIQFAVSRGVDREHSNQVTSLSMLLFDLFSGLHCLGEDEKLLLQSAAVMHDIGRIGGSSGHHKLSRDIILNSSELPFSERDRKVVALVARYHRKSHPQLTHPDFAALDARSREIVEKLSSMLRIADGFDRTHTRLVKGIDCEITRDKVVLHVIAEGFSDMDKASSLAKADLFEKVFGRKVVIDWFS